MKGGAQPHQIGHFIYIDIKLVYKPSEKNLFNNLAARLKIYLPLPALLNDV
jgi:hypothetical protein